MEENVNNQVEESASNAPEAVNVAQEQEKTVKGKISPKMMAIIAGVAVALIAIVVLLIAFGGGGESEKNDEEGGKSSEEIKEEQFAAAKDAYEDIVAAGEICIDIMDSIYAAWYFAIYESDDYDYSGWSKFIQFSSSTGLKSADVEAAMIELGFTSESYYIFDEFSYAVAVVEQVFITNGIYTTAEQNLADAKDSLKQVTSEYSDYTGYPTLKSYYSEVSSYLEFAKSPSGSFSQLKTTIDNYETNMRTYKNDLSFIFE